MRKIIVLVVCLMALSCHTSQKAVALAPSEKEMPENITHNLIISYENEDVLPLLKKEVQKYGAELLYEYQIIKGIAIKIPENKDIWKAKAHFSKLKGVLSVEYDHINQINND